MKINFDLSTLHEATNEKYYPLYENQNRYLILYGGAGSGKSHFIAQKKLLRIVYSYKRNYQEKFLVIRKTKNSLRESVFDLIGKYINKWNLDKLSTTNKSMMNYTFSNGSEIISSGLDDTEKLKSIEGITSIWIEEATEITEDDFIQVDLRLRGHTPSYKQIILSFNPITKLKWLYKFFFEKLPKDCHICHSTYKDNQFIDLQYKQILEGYKDISDNHYRIYTVGEWGMLQNIIYSNWDVQRIPQNDDYYDAILNGLDFGFNNPSALIRIGLKDNELHIFDELYERGKTNNALIPLVKKKVPKNQVITADSSEPARIEEFNQAGMRVKAAIKGKNSVTDGIDWVRRHKIHIHPNCVNTIKEIEGYEYKKDKDGNVLDEPVPFNDHLMDALRYGVEDLMQIEAASTGDNPSPKPTATGYRPGHSIGSGSMAERIKRHDQRIHDIDKDLLPSEDFY